MDGLLLDSERPVRDAWLAVTREKGYQMEASIFLEVIGRDDRDTRKVFHRHFGNSFPFDEIESCVRDVLAQRVGRKGYDLKAGAMELLQYLAGRSIPCVVATSTANSKARARLSKAGMVPYIINVSGGDEVSHGKPEPDLYLLAAKKLGITPVACLVFEDSAAGARAAHNAGMDVIVIPDLMEPPPDVRRFSMGIFRSLSESRPAVERWLEAKPTEKGSVPHFGRFLNNNRG